MRVDLGSGEEGMKNGKRRLSPRKTSAIWAPQATRPLPSRLPLCPGKAGSRLGGKAEDGEGLAASTGHTGGASSGQVAAESPSLGLAWHSDALGLPCGVAL